MKFTWTSKCQESFDQLKELLTKAPVLKVADPLKNYTVCTDASLEGVGGVLTQEGHVVCYESRKLKEHERNYVVHDLELAAVVHALKMWWHYLLGRKFLLLTDNTCVKNLFTQSRLNARQARWLAFLSEFDFEVKHIKGKENKVADALSRRTHVISRITSSEPKSDLLDRVKAASTQDSDYIELLSKIQNPEIKLDREAFKIDEKGFIWFKSRLYIPNVLEVKLFIMNEMHKPPFAGHPGYQKMVTALRKQFFWPSLKTDVIEYLSKCIECQQVKIEYGHPAGLLQPMLIPQWKWEIISLYFITGLPKTQKHHDSIMVVVDKLSKSAHFILVKSMHKAADIAEIFLK